MMPMQLNVKDIEIILEMLPDDMLQRQKDVKTKLEVLRDVMNANEEFQKTLIDLRKKFEEASK